MVLDRALGSQDKWAEPGRRMGRHRASPGKAHGQRQGGWSRGAHGQETSEATPARSRERLTVREGGSRGRGKSRGLRGSPVMGRQGWSLLSRPQVLHLRPRGVRLRGAHQAGVDGVPDDPALGVQQDGLHVRWVRPRAALQPAPLQGAAVRTGPRPLGSSAPGRSRGSVGASHTLSSTAGTCSPGCADTFTGMVLAHVQRPP